MPCDVRREYGKPSFGNCSATVVRCWKFLLTLSLLWIAAESHSQGQGPSDDFSAHTIVWPRFYHARSKREITNTREDDNSTHTNVLTVEFEINSVKKVLDLWLNTDLISHGYKQRHQHQGGYKTETPDSVELCQYKGNVRGIPESWVAVSTCRGLRGIVYDGQELHHIEPDEESLDAPHYLYKQTDLVANNTCGYEGTPHEVVVPVSEPRAHRTSRYKREANTVIRGPYNANRQSRYVELVLVIDKKEYVALGENLDKVHHHCKDIANIINALYTPLNIFVALVGVEVWTDTDEITLSSQGDATLRQFLNYRRETLVKKIPNDNAQLLTKVHFDGGVVGKALKGPICTYEFSGGVSMDHSNVIGLVAATMAHEMGHNFGMDHDLPACSCPEERCIMAPSSGSTGPVHWSSCSLEHLARAFEHGMDYCLRNKPKKLFDSPICGNGFVEPGEQCDCGLKEHCDNPCCNATTCMLHSNASCATGECCDLRTCKPKNAGTQCRSAEHECDLPEYCTGRSEYCPADVFKMDGEKCNMDQAYCYQGTCRTHSDQCKLLWGPTGSSSDAQCYNMNNKGTKHGNCGYNKVEESFVRCNDENILCGMLHCKHLNERLEFGMESVAILSHSFINTGGKIIACRSAMVDLGLNQVDPGLAPDGAKCAPGKMCVNQKCMPVADLRKSIAGSKGCPNNCGGNGVCNSLGHCHCNRGFHPPDCVQPGYGGSDDSGPAEDPNARNDFATALYIIFLGIVPMLALISLIVWYTKNNPNRHWKKEAISTKDGGNGGFAIKTIDRPMPRGIDTIDSSLSQDPACASLLPKCEQDERFNNNLFGQFKGFTLSALPTAGRKPPEPGPPASSSNNEFNNNVGLRNVGFVNKSSNNPGPALPPLNPGCTARPLISSPVLAATTCTSMELIGAKVPTRPAPEVPTRPRLETNSSQPDKPPRPRSTPPVVKVVVMGGDLDKKGQAAHQEKGASSTLNRIASILRPSSGIMRSNSQSPSTRWGDENKSTNSLARSHQHQKANKVLDKEILRNLEISAPIPQKEIEITSPTIALAPSDNNSAEKRPVVMRAQSMRDAKVCVKPAIHTFGSMRQANPPAVKRPSSIPASTTRPTSPPPPVPPPVANPPPNSDKNAETVIKIPGLPGYQNPPPIKIAQKPNEDPYDDCMNLIPEANLTKIPEESPSNDNIYAVIEESIPEKTRKKIEPGAATGTVNEYKAPKPIDDKVGEQSATTCTTTDGMGLLSEIVSEISNRNFDSIYSTSTLARKKKEKEEAEQRNMENLGSNSSISTYVNSSSHYKSPSSVYSNSPSAKFNSASSTTSSGYLNPSVINVPQQRGAKEDLVKSDLGSVDDDEKFRSLRSNNPNVNDAMSKALGMKPCESASSSSSSTVKSSSSLSSSSSSSSSSAVKKDEKKMEEKGKPPLCRTKTPPHIGKVTSGLSEKQQQMMDLEENSTNDTSEASSKSGKQNESGKTSSRQGSESNMKPTRQGSDSSFKPTNTAKQQSPTKSSKSSSEKRGSNGSLSKENSPAKLSNSPDLVASCSNSSSIVAKTSPDVTLSGNSRNSSSAGHKCMQKVAGAPNKLPNKTPSMPPKPAGGGGGGSILAKAATFAERKKSPGNSSPTTTPTTSLSKSLSPITKDSPAKAAFPTNSTKVTTKSEVKPPADTRTNPVQKAATSKSNVASLQQKFEANRSSSNPGRTVTTVSKKFNIGKADNSSASNSTKK